MHLPDVADFHPLRHGGLEPFGVADLLVEVEGRVGGDSLHTKKAVLSALGDEVSDVGMGDFRHLFLRGILGSHADNGTTTVGVGWWIVITERVVTLEVETLGAGSFVGDPCEARQVR